MQYLADFFVSESRKTPHAWRGDLPLIYDFVPVRTVHSSPHKWEEVYVF